jgi:glycosyltransferase involved in cell wall biosynthesis
MRILQVHTHYREPGGEDQAVETEARLLRDAGHEVLTWRAGNPEGARAAATLAVAPWNRAAAARLRRSAARTQPDIAHVHNTWFATSPAVVASLQELGIPVVMTLHNFRLMCAAATLFRDGATCRDCVGSHPWHAVEHRCYRGSRSQSIVAASTIALHQRRGTWRRDVDRFLALTEFGRQQFIAGGLPADRLEVKSNSVPDPGPRVRPPSAAGTVVYVGRLSEEKGIQTLLEAWQTSAANDLELVVVGSGPLEAELRARAPTSVRFTGSLPRADVATLLLDARALVFPSICYEGQGLVALEAAAAGLPVIRSDLGAMAELFAPGAEDLLFRPGDVASLSAALTLLADDRCVDQEGALARRRFEERYTHEVAARHLEEIYRSVLDANR